jgi:mono/diheme cytochrome c family protein
MRYLIGTFVLIAAATQAFAQVANNGPFAHPRQFSPAEGEALFRNICQGCHMADAKGAQDGAGNFGGGYSYPPLADNPRLENADCMIRIVANGRRGMPGFAENGDPAFVRRLGDAQIAAVASYVRSHFGNTYPEITAAEVTAAKSKQSNCPG